MPLISVIMAVHNSEKSLSASITSILAQSVADWELLAIDDASTDNSVEALQKFCDPRIKIHRLPKNVGPAGARNAGIKVAEGKFLAILDSDDTALPHRFHDQLEALEKESSVGACASPINPVWARDFSSIRIRTELLFRNVVIHSSLIFRREAVQGRPEVYDSSLRYSHDYGLVLDLARDAGLCFSDRPSVNYVTHSENVSTRFAEAQRGFSQEVQRRELKRLALSPSSAEAQAHYHLGLRTGFSSPDQLSLAGRWLAKLLAENQRKRRYSQKHLLDVTSCLWMAACQNSSVPAAHAIFCYALGPARLASFKGLLALLRDRFNTATERQRNNPHPGT